MQQRFLFMALFMCYVQLFAQKKQFDKPKLVVGVVIDQMRTDYLYRYAHHYGDKGFKRLMNQGFNCENTFINYLPSYTAPGHACIYTGSVPSLHGIASNDWIDKLSGDNIYCTQDNKVSAVGGTQRAGKMSPGNLWANTIGDELKLAANFRSKVFAISVKDRAAILPGGHAANAAYWMDDSDGVFMSSTYYMKELPGWVTSFNNSNLPQKYMQQNWSLLRPVDSYTQYVSDNNSYEGKFSGEMNTTFPHRLSQLRLADIKKTPYGNDILLDFAKELIAKEKLGQSSETDMLCVSFSSTDYIGHMYGPNSLELEDTYARMDKTIADLLTYLDEVVGKGAYTLFLSSDHGVAHNPAFLLDHKMPGGFFFGKEITPQLNKHLEQKYKHPNLVRAISENYVWLKHSVIDSMDIDKEDVKKDIISYLQIRPEVHYAVDMEDMDDALIPKILHEKSINGYVHGRSGDILLLLKPGWLDAYSKTGTTHGTWNPYDTRIPLLWYGWGVKKGISYRLVRMTDIAATLSSLLHIQMPNACIGEPIIEVLE